ncbi:MAG: CCA tRNA nucleotidyltransferase [Lachnospiraceae bacterium]|nr:CCA tRNA nucleotidyltransferase [Lachnospiraceae bacterium]MBO4824634.1 CCA tRNA nucleotidyltransferase [Lachnospiraceae bacterium]
MKIDLPKNVKFIIDTLESAGYEAYAVGGCVRDSILGRTPNDWDITTSAKPLETKALFKKTFDTGIKHGTISVLLGKEIYEVTTYRIDGEYEDARHPKEVTFTAELKEDLLRRDFTINAMAYNPTSGIVDLYGGIEDLKNHVIRCVGVPHDRFSEDALRIMRAVRFAAQLDYTIEEKTQEAIRELAGTLSKISAERIQVELIKLLTSDHPEFLKLAWELGITKVILPEFDRAMESEQNNPNHAYSVGEHSLKVMQYLPPDKVMRLAGLFHDIGKMDTKTTDEKGVDHFYGHPEVGAKIAAEVFNRLKFDNDTKTKVCRLVECHDWFIGAVPSHIRRYMNRIGEEFFPMIFDFNKADIMAQSFYNREEKLEDLEVLKEAYLKVKEAGDCINIKDLVITGSDVIKAGVPAGPGVGAVLKALLEEVLDNPAKNNKDYLLSRIDSLK